MPTRGLAAWWILNTSHHCISAANKTRPNDSELEDTL